MNVYVDKINAFLKDFESELTSAAEELDKISMPPLTEELFSAFERYGNRLCYESPYFLRRKFLSVYGILVTLFDRYEYLSRLEYVINEICKEECWALPAHVDRRNREWCISIDLFAAETAASLAEIISKLKGRISNEVYQLAKNEVFRRVLDPFINSTPPYSGWETSENNWCAVCSGSIGIAAYYLVNEKVLPNGIMDRICASLRHYINGFSSDGACLEGLGYYTYGLSFYVAFGDILSSYTNGKNNIFAEEKFREIALFQEKCFLGNNATISFSDAMKKDSFRVGLTSYLAMIHPEVTFPDFSMAAGLESDNCYRYLILSRDVIFARKYLSCVKNNDNVQNKREDHIVLPCAEWSVCKSKNGAAFAIKGGHNDEPHNHNDVGSFLYVVNGEHILTDIGAGEYTKDYFGDRRYDNLCCRSMGHNVPIIGGKEQLSGKEYRSSRFEADGNGKTIIGIEKAYPLEREEKVTRTVDFDIDTGNFRITDEFELNADRIITENLISCFEPIILQNGFSIQTEAVKVTIICDNGTDFRSIPQEYSDHFGNPTKVWQLQWRPTEHKAETKILLQIQ